MPSLIGGHDNLQRMTSEERGLAGQSLVVSWLHDAKSAATQSAPDKYGWDLFVEMAAAESAGHPGDLQPTNLSCKIQVKTIAAGKRNVDDIKLDNWHRMAKQAIPWFVVVLEYGATDVPQGAFVVHVWKELIAETLKRLRKRQGGSRPVHKQRMRLRLLETDRLAELNGQALVRRIRDVVGNQAAYVAEKQHLIESVGYESGIKGRLQFAFDRKTLTDEMMAEFAVGLLPRLPIQSVVVSDVRFGMASKTGEHKDVVLEVPNLPHLEAELELLDLQESLITSIVIEARWSHRLFPFLPVESQMLRLSNALVQIVFKGSKPDVSFSFTLDNGDAAIDLGGLRRAADFINALIMRADEPMILRLNLPDREPIIVRIADIGEFVATHGTLLAEIRSIVDTAWLARRVGLPDATSVTAHGLIDMGDIAQMLRAAFENTPGSFQASAVVLEEVPQMWGAKTAFVVCPAVRVGLYAVVASVAIEGAAERIVDASGRVRGMVRATHARVIEHRVIDMKRAAATAGQIAEELSARGLASYQGSGVEYVIAAEGLFFGGQNNSRAS